MLKASIAQQHTFHRLTVNIALGWFRPDTDNPLYNCNYNYYYYYSSCVTVSYWMTSYHSLIGSRPRTM